PVVTASTVGAGVSDNSAAQVGAAAADRGVCTGAEAGRVCTDAAAGGVCTAAHPVLPSIVITDPNKQYAPTLTRMTAPKE
ncbi:MAG TPA: hypothetical protein VJZ25_07760, partial [Gemmatimonadaceae bacterium]|nr:hypothetical protein [Gemmatimonadaceae bacterium]